VIHKLGPPEFALASYSQLHNGLQDRLSAELVFVNEDQTPKLYPNEVAKNAKSPLTSAAPGQPSTTSQVAIVEQPVNPVEIDTIDAGDALAGGFSRQGARAWRSKCLENPPCAVLTGNYSSGLVHPSPLSSQNVPGGNLVDVTEVLTGRTITPKCRRLPLVTRGRDPLDQSQVDRNHRAHQ